MKITPKTRDACHKISGLFNSALRLAVPTMSVVVSVAVSSVSVAAVNDREQAKFIHDRLTGMLATDAMLDVMEASIVSNNPAAAARYAIDGNAAKGDPYRNVITPSGGFYNAVLKNWASPWTNEAQDIFQPLNDYSASVIGFVRDDKNFSTILSADSIYTGPNVGSYSNSNNDHYINLEASSADFGDSTVLIERVQSATTQTPAAGVAGVLTTRAAARAYFVDGTNRAMFRFTLLNHLCNDLEQYKDNELPTDRIRQDVSRSPGGDSSIFLNDCAGCHTGMDAMAQAFAYYNFDYPTDVEQPGLTETERMDLGSMVYAPGVVQTKYLHNEGNFRDGFVTPDDHWINYWRTGPNAQKIGWSGSYSSATSIDAALDPAYAEGDGAASLGQELASSDAFAYCQVKKAFKAVCLRDPQQGADQTAFETVVGSFKSGYDMKQAFIDIAVHCSAHLNP